MGFTALRGTQLKSLSQSLQPLISQWNTHHQRQAGCTRAQVVYTHSRFRLRLQVCLLIMMITAVPLVLWCVWRAQGNHIICNSLSTACLVHRICWASKGKGVFVDWESVIIISWWPKWAPQSTITAILLCLLQNRVTQDLTQNLLAPLKVFCSRS